MVDKLLDLVSLLRPRRRRPTRRPRPSTTIEVARSLTECDPQVPDRQEPLDPETARDLDLDEVFLRVDRALSSSGSQLLYHDLHRPPTSGRLERRIRESAAFEQPSVRDLVDKELGRMAEETVDLVPLLLWEELPRAPVTLWQLRLLGLGLPLCAAAALVFPVLWLVVAAWFIANVWLAHAIEQTIRPQTTAIRGMTVILDVARRLSKETAVFTVLSTTLATHAHAARTFERRAADLLLALNLLDLGEYLNAVFLYRATVYAALRQDLLRSRPALQAVFLEVAEVDVCQSIAMLRHQCPKLAEPEHEDGSCLEVVGLWSPLLDDPIHNDLTVDGGVLVTGANMSGKSTLLKALGVSVVMARSFGLVCAERWRGHRDLVVRTAFHSNDDLLRGESFFFAEARRALELVNQSSSSQRTLFLIDELFKGTNPDERVAAAAAILVHLSHRDLVVAASHDLALWNHLAASFTPFHFGSSIGPDPDHELRFDYRLHPGHVNARYAIATLASLGFPDPIVTDARRRLSGM